MTGGRVLLTVLALAGTLLLPACTDDQPPPRPSTTSEPSTRPSTPAVTPPSEPDIDHTAQGATAFVRYFWDLYNYAYASYDTAPIADRSDPSCRFCASLIQRVQELEASNTRVEGYEAHVAESALPTIDVSDRALVVIVVTQSAGTEVPASGTPQALPATPATRFSFGLRWDSGSWKIHGVDFEKAK